MSDNKLDGRLEELAKEYSKTLTSVPSYQSYVEGLVYFLVDKIEQLENPMIVSKIEVQKGGDNHGNPTQKQSEVKE